MSEIEAVHLAFEPVHTVGLPGNPPLYRASTPSGWVLYDGLDGSITYVADPRHEWKPMLPTSASEVGTKNERRVYSPTHEEH